LRQVQNEMSWTVETIKRLAGETYFQRGESYYRAGRVHDLEENFGRITATVLGTHDYAVWLKDAGKEFDYECDCPLGIDGAFCKHCVAVGLAWIERGAKIPAKKLSKGEKEFRTSLEKKNKSELIEMILEEISVNKTWREKLFLRMTEQEFSPGNLSRFKQAIDRAFRFNGFIEYHEMPRFVAGVLRVVDSIGELLQKGHAAAVIELTEYALKLSEKVFGASDDSSGRMGEVTYELQRLHLEACRRAKPDAAELARRLFKWALESDWEIFADASATYRDVLGEKGLRIFRESAEAEWKKLPPLAPGKSDFSHRRFALTSMMENFARESGNVEDLVEILRKDLSKAYDYLEIAKLYQKAGDQTKALVWAEKGVAVFGFSDGRLNEFLVESYLRKGDWERAVEIVWQHFEERPDLSKYRELHHVVGQKNKAEVWKKWREKALSYIRKYIRNNKDQGFYWQKVDATLLVEIFLWENEIEAAWEEALKAGCRQDVWLRLAKERGRTHPKDALGVYQALIPDKINETNNHAYELAFEWILETQKLMNPDEFAAYTDQLRETFKAKRNFIKMLAGLEFQ
jgi:uncharacterized Zn finger protein